MPKISKTQKLITTHVMRLATMLSMSEIHVKELRRLSSLATQVNKGEIHQDLFLEVIKAFTACPQQPFVAVRDAVNQFDVAKDRIIQDWLSDDESYIEWDMLAMYLGDAADHLEIAIAFRDGATLDRLSDMLWDMDTASREEAAQDVWNLAFGDE